jgi:hypothetical protein
VLSALYLALTFLLMVTVAHNISSEFIDIKLATTLGCMACIVVAASIGAISKEKKWKTLLVISFLAGLLLVIFEPAIIKASTAMLIMQDIIAIGLYSGFCYFQAFRDKTGHYGSAE